MKARGIGERLREARLERGLSVRALSEAAGVSKSAISSIETGEHDPSCTTVERLARALDVSPCWLAYGLD